MVNSDLSCYRNNQKYWDRQAFENSVDSDQNLKNGASGRDLHCLPYLQQYFRHIKWQSNELFQILG